MVVFIKKENLMTKIIRIVHLNFIFVLPLFQFNWSRLYVSQVFQFPKKPSSKIKVELSKLKTGKGFKIEGAFKKLAKTEDRYRYKASASVVGARVSKQIPCY